MASRFVPIECPIDEFIQKQAKEFLKAKQVDKDVENIEPSELNELVSAFLVEMSRSRVSR
jgi:hypothetical protein